MVPETSRHVILLPWTSTAARMIYGYTPPFLLPKPVLLRLRLQTTDDHKRANNPGRDGLTRRDARKRIVWAAARNGRFSDQSDVGWLVES